MSSQLNPAALRGLRTSHEIAEYLREAAKIIPQALLTDQLLRATEQEILAPDVFCIWLSISRSTSTIISGLKQPFSNLIRHNAILGFGKMLLTTQWQTAWIDVGGTPGIISFLEGSSTDEVATFCTALGRTGKLGKGDVEPKRGKITELLKGLLPQFYPESLHKTRDRRPLSQYYAALVSSCRSEYVEQVLRNGGYPFPIYGCLPSSQIAQYHWPLLRKLALELIEGDESAQWPGTDAKKNFFNYHLSYLLLHIPQLPSTEGGFSAPMAFSLSVLRILASKTEDVDLGRRSVTYGIIEPLISRMGRRKIGTDAVQEVISLVVKYYKIHPKALTYIDSSSTTEFTSLIIKSWCKSPSVFEAPLCTYFGLTESDFTGTSAWLTRDTAKEYRYRLLRLAMLHCKGSKVDIDGEDGLTACLIRKWPRELIESLPTPDAVGLLRRLIKIHPECEFLGTTDRWPRSPTILAQAIEPGSAHLDPILLITKMGYDQDDIMSKGKEMIQTNKEKAVKSRDHEGRAFFAKSAAFYAIATGSLDVYEDVILWSKRFLRDPQAVRIIFHEDALCTREGLALLSGIPKDFRNLRSEGIRSMVLKGNQIVLHLFEVAVMALKEQSFAVRNWRGVLSLLSKVVVRRIQQSWRLKMALHMGPSDIYHILWESTLEMLLKAETLGLEPGHEALEFDSPLGCVNAQLLKSSRLQKVCASTHTFLDNLASGRDRIWQIARPTWYPATAVLDRPWPRGLPIQCYCHLRGLAEESLPDQYPFILSRAKSILFLERNLSIDTTYPDEEARQAIGSYVDNYESALEVYTLGYTNSADRAKAAGAALTHAIKLCSDRMTRLEALRYLRPRFQRQSLVKFCRDFDEINEEQNQHLFPLVPDMYDPRERTEWNPLSGKPEAVVSKPFTPTILDYMLSTNAVWFERRKGYFAVLQPKTLDVHYSEFWSSSRLQKIGRKDFSIQDASIASALLFLDARLPGPPQMLVSPYPTAQAFRLPSIFLDQDFLDATKDDRETAALSVLELFLRRVPPNLLQILTKAAVKDLAATPTDFPDISTRQSVAFRLLQLLARSDNPGLACEGILDMVLNNPDASSWHRFLLTKTFLQRLPGSAAKVLLESFIQGIQQKLRDAKQARRQAVTQKSPEGSPEAPVIKLTTVKLLAQFFEDATVIPVAESTSMLATLFRGAGSLDVRMAVVNSLLSRLSECKDDISNPVAEQILSTLELAVPVIGSLSERQVMSEKDWIESEQTGQLPEIYEDGDMSKRPPMLDAVYQACTSSSHQRQKIQRVLFNRVLLPAIELSRVNNERWMKLFFKKYFPESNSNPLPIFPVRPNIAGDLLCIISKAPVMLLELHLLSILTNIWRPRPVDTLVETIEADHSFRSSNAGKHFLNMYNNTNLAFYRSRFGLKELKGWAKPKPSGSITVTHIQDFILAQAQAFLLRPINSVGRYVGWDKHLYTPPLITVQQKTKESDIETWLAYVRPVLMKLIDFVEAMRQGQVHFPLSASFSASPSSLTFLQDPHVPSAPPSPYLSVPHLLPDLDFPRFWVESPCPHLLLATTESEKRRLRAAYACQIVTFVRGLLHSKPSHTWMSKLQDQLQQWTGRDADRWPIISLLGDTQRFDRPIAAEKDEGKAEPTSFDGGPMDMDVDEASGVVEISAEAAEALRVRSPAELIVRVELADKLLERILGLGTPTRLVDGQDLDKPTRLVHGWLTSASERVREIAWLRTVVSDLKLPA